MDSVYPEPLSVLYKRAVRKKVHKNNSGRYRTQPITFSEIKEVDEENVEDNERTAGAQSKSELDLKAKFEEFKRQRDRDLRDSRLGPTDSILSGTPEETGKEIRHLRQDASKARPIPSPVANIRTSYTLQRPSI